MTNDAMTSDTAMDIERLARFFDAWNAHDVDTIVSYFTPAGAYLASIGPDDGGTEFHGTSEIRRGVAAFLGTYEDAHYSDLARQRLAGLR